MNFFLGQIGVFGFNFPPKGWAQAVGTILPIAQNSALYSLLGTTYGGNGTTTFGLPDLRSRTPMGQGTQTTMGEIYGTETVTLSISEMPAHTHSFNASMNPGSVHVTAGHFFAAGPNNALAYGTSGNTLLNAASITPAGSSQPHNNIQPSLAINFCIATTGIYPARN